MDSLPYSKYVKHLHDSFERFDLKSFLSFLQSPHEGDACQIGYLEFTKDGTSCYSRLSLDQLINKLYGSLEDDKTPDCVAGVCILVEDIGPWTTDALGTILDVDPYFFHGHVDRSFSRVERDPLSPLITSLPSHMASQNFVNIHYQRPVDLGECDAHLKFPYHLNVEGQSLRPARCLPPLFGKHVGFIHSCFSMLHKQFKDDQWICLMLMDSITVDIVANPSEKDNAQNDNFKTRQVPYRYKRTNLNEVPTFSEYRQSPHSKGIIQTSFLDEVAMVLRSCTRVPPNTSSTHDPSYLLMAPVKLIVDEWLIYSLVMGRYVKVYERMIKDMQSSANDLESQNILDLYRWGRRGQQSLHKLQVLKWFVESFAPEKAESPLIRDISYIMDQIEQNEKALKDMMPIMTSIIQLLDSHRSIVEAVYIKKLTYIALVFLPLSFIATLFSMSDYFSINGNRFWIYISSAIVLLLLIVVASIPSRKMTGFFNAPFRYIWRAWQTR